ncbi:unnamed protein product [Ilex paraguariensis]|uniref:Cysteine-rich receptor-like protein kinase 29 n=1 Tax=Ilex paraguariensis TaxID=185542 RepID=A0ABC8TQK2_9AQUA
MDYWTVLLFFLSHILILNYFGGLTIAQPDFGGHNCTGNSTSSMYEANKNTLLSSLLSNIDKHGFYNSSVGHGSDRVYAIVLCRGDVELDTCRSCISDAISMIEQHCPNFKGAVGWYAACMLRFSNQNIFSTLETRPTVSTWNFATVSDVVGFNRSLRTLVDSLRDKAASGGSPRKFAAGSISASNNVTIYALLQCTPDLSQQQCINCLDLAAGNLPNCCAINIGGQILSPSCTLHYENYRFYSEIQTQYTDKTPASPPGKNNGATRTIIIIVVLTVITVILMVCIFNFLRKKKHRKPKEKNETVDEISIIETLQYDFGTIRIATDNFSHSNKLGKGGFGTVYKGRLPNGQEIAVKMLSRNSKEGEREFRNEVLLLMKLQHRNLVRLLGFCLQAAKRILIYEFVPNASLDHFIFDPIKRANLDWDLRFKIIEGIARGLQYLHEDSRLRVIHRDLKASNVLLDAEMNPKISDFGLARPFAFDESQGNTSRIVGTYGYMAPEYAMHGQFSVKSDVFSFGVLVLEIISGKKNNCFQHGENVEDLLSYAWKKWQDGRTPNIIDPKLLANSGGSIPDIMRCVHIGLLCVQENVTDRPTMASIVLMLSSFSLTFPIPSEPASLMLRSIDPKMALIREDDSRATQSNQLKNNSDCWTVDQASITELYPR